MKDTRWCFDFQILIKWAFYFVTWKVLLKACLFYELRLVFWINDRFWVLKIPPQGRDDTKVSFEYYGKILCFQVWTDGVKITFKIVLPVWALGSNCQGGQFKVLRHRSGRPVKKLMLAGEAVGQFCGYAFFWLLFFSYKRKVTRLQAEND